MAKCVQCGYCCTLGCCSYGIWDYEKEQCSFLTEESLCAKYDEILKDPDSKMSPAFGAGCSSSLFNTRRDKALRKNVNSRKN